MLVAWAARVAWVAAVEVRLFALLVVLSAGVACESAPAPPAPVPTASTGLAAPVVGPKITVQFDDEVRDVALGKVPLSLADVLPEAGRDPVSWRELSAKSSDGKRTLAVQRFAEKYANHDVRLYVDDQGRPAVGIFRRMRADMPAHVKATLAKPHIVLVDAESVQVRTKEVVVPKREQPPLTVSIDGVDKKLTPSDLAGLNKASPPGEQPRQRQRKGWRLQDVIGLVTPLSSVAHVKLLNDADDSLMVKGDALVKDELVVLLRYNNRGALGLTSWDVAKGGEPRRMRDVVKLVIASK